jgi:hypothetical protein
MNTNIKPNITLKCVQHCCKVFFVIMFISSFEPTMQKINIEENFYIFYFFLIHRKTNIIICWQSASHLHYNIVKLMCEVTGKDEDD